MTDERFQNQLAQLKVLPFQEDFNAALCNLYVTCEPAQRAALRRDVSAGKLRGAKAWKNPTDFLRTDLTREQRLRESLLFMSLTGGSDDYRDDLCNLAYCYHNLWLLNLDANAIFEEIAKLSDPEFARFIRSFVNRSPEHKSMEAFGLNIVQTADGSVVNRVL